MHIRGVRVFSRCEDVAKDRNTREEHLVWTVGNGDPMYEVCIPHNTLRMETARVKEEVGADTKIIVKGKYEIWKEGTWAP